MKHREANRMVVVREVSVAHVKQGSIGFPEYAFVDPEIPPPEVWIVRVHVQEGLKPEISSFRICESRDEADLLAEAYKPGTIVPEDFWPGGRDNGHRFILGDIGADGPILTPGDTYSHLAFQVLVEAGIHDKNGPSASREVLDYLGKDRVDELKATFGDKWSPAAEFEYCKRELPYSSAAYVAAAFYYHAFATGNAFLAGYFFRDLEILVGGVEAEALKTLAMRKRAGAAGSKKSAAARATRIASLMSAIEEVTRRNPDLMKLGEEALGRLALTRAEEANTALWQQGKGQVMEYIGEIRRGEAGNELQARFRSAVGGKPPKQL